MAENLSQYANYELGESFFEIVNNMVMEGGITLSKVGEYDFLSPSWRKLANKPDKTDEDLKKIDSDYKSELINLADSCILFMSAKLKKRDYKFNFEEYKKFINVVDRDITPLDSNTLKIYNKQLQTAFLKIANHGEENGDNLIDRYDWAAYIYSLDLTVERDDKNEFSGFSLNGKITPINYALSYNQLREDKDNMASLKLRQAYQNLFG